MNKEEYVKFAKAFFEDGLQVTLAKNHDYSGESDDFFNNFKALSVHGIDPRIGFIARMQDKLNRIANFVKTDTLMVSDESVADTFSDLCNYTIIFAAFCKSLEDEDSKG